LNKSTFSLSSYLLVSNENQPVYTGLSPKYPGKCSHRCDRFYPDQELSMERFLGAFEHSFWLYDQVEPVHFALSATIRGRFSVDQLRHSLTQAQQQHPLLRVCIVTDETGRPKFVEHWAELPLRVVARTSDQQWQQELATEMSRSFSWATAPLARVVLLQSELISELIVTCHHSIADGMSGAYLIRDLVQGLETQVSTGRTLVAALPIEEVTPSFPTLSVGGSRSEASEDEVSTGLFNHFPTSLPVSSRPCPHLRTALLDRALTRQLNELCRREQATVHGAISAAFLLTLGRQTKEISAPLKCLSPINVRSHLTPAVEEAVGLYIGYGRTNHDLSGGPDLWEIARSLKIQLAEARQPDRLFAEVFSRQLVMATGPDVSTVVQGMQQQYGYDLLVTNLGRLPFGPAIGSLHIEALYGPAVMAGMAQERVVGVATCGDRLSLTLSCPSTTTSSEQATDILTTALQILQEAALIIHLNRV
jgi:Condensation domain